MRYVKWFVYDPDCPAWVDAVLCLVWLVLVAAEHKMYGWTLYTSIFSGCAGSRFDRVLRKAAGYTVRARKVVQR